MRPARFSQRRTSSQADGSVDARVGARIRIARVSARVGISQLARETGASPLALIAIEEGSLRPTAAQLYEIANALGASLAELFADFTGS